jgi:hypothetical protein
VVQQLLGAGARVEAADSEGWRSLHWASQNSHDQVVEQLLQAGATAEVHDTNGERLLLQQQRKQLQHLWWQQQHPNASYYKVQQRCILDTRPLAAFQQHPLCKVTRCPGLQSHIMSHTNAGDLRIPCVSRSLCP